MQNQRIQHTLSSPSNHREPMRGGRKLDWVKVLYLRPMMIIRSDPANHKIYIYICWIDLFL
jgi:hypothetical protein